MIDAGRSDRRGRRVTLREIGDDWRAVADVAPHDDQRDFVFPLAARYLLLSLLGDDWRSLGIYADEVAVGHVMWAVDDDGSHWIGGLVIDAAQQGIGLGNAATATLTAWLLAKPACPVVRLSYHPDNIAAARLYAGLGFAPTGETVDGETVVQCARLEDMAAASGDAATVTAFNDCINAADLRGLTALMSPDHTFIDSSGAGAHGRDAALAAWRRFFVHFPDYRNVFDEIDVRDDLVVVTGRSECPVDALDGPAIWTARVRNGLLTEWRVHDDTPEQRAALGLRT
jgi:diamine N-acetyltransferase